MQSRVPWTAILAIGFVWISGCGGAPSSSPPVRTVPNNVVTVAPTTVPQQGSNATASAPKPKPAATTKKSTIPPNTDPKTIFNVGSIGQPMEITGTTGQVTSDQYVVAYADPRNDASKFTVDSIKPSTQLQPLVGTGRLKSGFTLPKGFTEFKATGYNTDGFPMRIVCTKTGSQLGLIPAGTSIVGTDDGPEESKPSFTVQLDLFYMEITEVTVQDFEKFRTDMKEKKKPSVPAPSNPSSASNSPALGITWGSAQSYARWAGMELPTESEFEKAARGPNGLRTPWGEGRPLWGNRTMTTVGAYPADSSPYGILDLAGNAKEWCADLYSPTAHTEAAIAANKDTLKNWPGPKKVREMNLRVVKGSGPDWSSWHREGKDVQKIHFDVGFRCVLRIPPDSK